MTFKNHNSRDSNKVGHEHQPSSLIIYQEQIKWRFWEDISQDFTKGLTNFWELLSFSKG